MTVAYFDESSQGQFFTSDPMNMRRNAQKMHQQCVICPVDIY